MLKRNLVFGLVIALAGGCVMEEDEGDAWLNPGGKADNGGGYPAFLIDESGNGQTFDVLDGQQIIVRLPSNPTTGYQWSVAETDRTFGYPESTSYVAVSQTAGSRGHTLLIWQTRSFVPMTGRHTVVLELRRRWEDPRVTPAEREFTFTVDIHRAGPPAVVIEDGDDGASFDAVQGQDIIVRLTSNPTTGYDWTVAATDRTFGYPEYISHVPLSEATGGGGYTELLWRTEPPFDVTGEHHVRLELRRPWEPVEVAAVERFDFTVVIGPSEAAE